MQTQDFDAVLDRVLAEDPRYQREAYYFLREALDATQKAASKANPGKLRHVSGQELVAGIRDYALAQYGPMTLTLLHEWGLRTCADFGELVFNLIARNVLSKTETDSRSDFQDGYDFDEAFAKPFRPRSASSPHSPQVSPS